MNRIPLDANPEILQNNAPEQSEQPSPIQTADLEVGAGGTMPEIPRPENTPRLKVQS